ncbi:GNAT family N-acetyltransferase [Flavobacterium sp.]|uniref:GNAT family N-acetyltransferase n=1 Tax=Flavobacterium sp. TaxID=239 RepID=UPI00374D55B0
MNEHIIREIQKTDNLQVANVIRTVLIEHNVPKVGTAYADPQLDFMFEAYSEPNSMYFVVEKKGKIIGCAGIAPLQNGSPEICELQKMYFLSETRGLGIGTKMMEICLQKAKDFGFKKCYLETMPYMKAAQKLYLKSGFEYLCEPMGNTGHTSCPVWMIKQLTIDNE